jgi:Uma2 family endonuclease
LSAGIRYNGRWEREELYAVTEVRSRSFTYEDYLLFPDDGKRYEIVDGEKLVTPAPFIAHQRASTNLTRILSTWTSANGSGETFHAPFDVILSPADVVQPDSIVIGRERADIITPKNVAGAPDLVVEILSESTRKTDFLVKRKTYERFGVREYWIVDPEIRRVEVFVLRDGSLRKTSEHAAGESIESSAFRGLTVRVEEIFA